VIAAISIFGPKNRLFPERIGFIGDTVRDTAATISARLGYKPK
jgi:DNA-binding IclR family transcriptional regulator